MIQYSIFIFSILAFSSYGAVQDFCVADLTGPKTHAGFNCKNSTSVTVKDFVYSGFTTPGPYSNLTKVSLKFVFVDQFPGLNGLGISMGWFDMEVGAVGQMHTHPAGNEIFFIVSGSVTAGFISSDNTAYLTDLKAGDMIVFPQGLPHFLWYSGPTGASAFGTYASERPGVQILDLSLFGNELPTEILAKSTFLDAAEIKKLKTLFGGTN